MVAVKKPVLKDGKYCVIITHEEEKPMGKFFNNLAEAKTFYKKSSDKISGKNEDNMVQLLEKTGKTGKDKWKTIEERQITTISWR